MHHLASIARLLIIIGVLLLAHVFTPDRESLRITRETGIAPWLTETFNRTSATAYLSFFFDKIPSVTSVNNTNTIATETYQAMIQDARKILRQVYQIDELTETYGLAFSISSPITHQPDTDYTIDVLKISITESYAVSANVYRPLTESDSLPLVLLPLGCGSTLATHNNAVSPQRQAANLAKNGIIAVVADSLCFNQENTDPVLDSPSQEIIAFLHGVPLTTRSLSVALWDRLLTHTLNNYPVDSSRIGITGYSNGGQLTRLIAALRPEIDMVIPVATHFSVNSNLPYKTGDAQAPKTYVRTPSAHNASFYRDFYAIENNFYFQDSLRQFSTTYAPHVPNDLHLLVSNLRDLLISNRTIVILLGTDDSGTSVEETSLLIKKLTTLSQQIGTPSPHLITVPGDHTYDQERRERTLTLFMEQFYGTNQHIREVETPLLAIHELEHPSAQRENTTLATIFNLLTTRSKAQTSVSFTDIVPLPPITTTPILIDEYYINQHIRAAYYLLRLNNGATHPFVLFRNTEPSHDKHAAIVSAHDFPLLTPTVLQSIANSKTTLYFPLLGIGPLAPTQESSANFALRLVYHGTSLQAINTTIFNHALTFVAQDTPQETVIEATDSDSSTFLAYYRLLPSQLPNLTFSNISQSEITSIPPSPFTIIPQLFRSHEIVESQQPSKLESHE